MQKILFKSPHPNPLPAGEGTKNAVFHIARLPCNAAERTLRPYVIWRKISFFTQSHPGNLYRLMMLSLIESCKCLQLNTYQTLRTICRQGLTEGQVTLRLPFSEPLRVASELGA